MQRVAEVVVDGPQAVVPGIVAELLVLLLAYSSVVLVLGGLSSIVSIADFLPSL